MKQKILDTIRDVVSNFLYYDRNHDEDLPMGVIEETVKKGELSIDEIVAAFKTELEKELSE